MGNSNGENGQDNGHGYTVDEMRDIGREIKDNHSDQLPGEGENEIEFFDQSSRALYHSDMVIDKGRAFHKVGDDSGRKYIVVAVGPDSMQVRLKTKDGATETVHWPSEGGQYIPVDGTGFDGYR
ncbi:hypothetical protein [Halomicrobium salinisoli]|uniref:hypothetical protein n=1 Tax=Halomicrobium salinisoli TaxID=2878391 RepID=UPI001CEFF182|nr:hypothetical protein [Halomicrobium salinisoli]